jgi:hypothetical protein
MVACETEGCRKPARPGGKRCERCAKALQRHGVVPELAFAHLLDLVFRLGAIETGEDQDRDFDRTLEEFRQAYIVAARVYPRPPPLSQRARRIRSR